MTDVPVRQLAKASGFDFGIEDHGLPVLFGTFNYEGAGQGLGYMVDIAFLMRFLDVFGVSRLQEVNGKSCWVTATGSNVLLLEPLHRRDGSPFDIEEWRAWKARRKFEPSAYEMRTGKRP